MSRFLLLIAFAIGMTVTLGTFAETNDWPQWRGPDRTGISQEKELLQAWPEEGPTLLWLNENCGIGYSAPTVAKDHLVTMGARDNVEQLICLDANSGEELWAIDVGENYENGWGDGPRSSPTIDGERVFALGANGDLVCAELATGKVQWKVDLADLGAACQTGVTRSLYWWMGIRWFARRGETREP